MPKLMPQLSDARASRDPAVSLELQDYAVACAVQRHLRTLSGKFEAEGATFVDFCRDLELSHGHLSDRLEEDGKGLVTTLTDEGGLVTERQPQAEQVLHAAKKHLLQDREQMFQYLVEWHTDDAQWTSYVQLGRYLSASCLALDEALADPGLVTVRQHAA